LTELEGLFDGVWILGISLPQALECPFAFQRFVDLILIFIGWGIIAQNPIDGFTIAVEEHDGGGGADGVFGEDDLARRFLGENLNQDEILGQEVFIGGVIVKLLTEQSAAPSGIGAEIEENQLVLRFGLGERLVQGAFEPIRALGGCGHGQQEKKREGQRFFHDGLRSEFQTQRLYASPAISVNPVGD